MLSHPVHFSLLVFAFILSQEAFAQTIKIGIGQQAIAKQEIQRPSRGDTKTLVHKKFGEPLKRIEATGQPPISSWEYEDFKVYFESNQVIHSVLKHRPRQIEEK